MKNWYKATGVALLFTWAAGEANAQTHYGTGAGIGGINHAFFGVRAGTVNTGAGNSFFGYESGFSNKAGKFNTFSGSSAGYNNTTGNSNTFLGAAAGYLNESGSDNVFIGNATGVENVAGGNNVYIGNLAAWSKKAGDGNVIIGKSANSDGEAGNFNCFLGYQSGLNNAGDMNSFIGFASGFYNTTGTSNVFIGAESGQLSDHGTANAFLGNKSGYNNSGGNNNAFVGYGAGYDNTTGEKNTYLGYASGGDPTLVNATAIGAQAKVTKSNSIVLGRDANVGVGVSAPSYQLTLSSSQAGKPGTSTWVVASDRRLKKDISDFTDGLDLLKKVKPVWFSYTGEAGIKTDKKFVGIIAQEMQQIAPYMIGSFTYQDSLGNKTDYLDYDANAMTYMLINSVKEQQAVIEQKDSEIKELNERMTRLEALVAAVSRPGNVASSPSEFHSYSGAGVILEQNTPNGFSDQTAIKYFVPQSIKTASIEIYTVDGVKVDSYQIDERGAGELHLSSTRFKSGLHIYDLITDGKSAGAKKMLVK